MRRGLCAAAAAVVVALSTTPLLATPARAQSSVAVTPSKFAMSPSPGTPITTSLVSVSGHFNASGGFQPVFDWVSIDVVWNKGGPGPSQTYVFCGKPPNAQQGAPCPGNDFDFTQKFEPPLAYNGPYKVTATGQAHDQAVIGNPNPVTGTTDPIAFQMKVPPPDVTGVTATVDSKTRFVTVSWNRDTMTPDDQSYWIYRKGPGESTFVARSQTGQQSTGARLSVTDQYTANAGGDYLYQIETHRNGATGDGSSFVVSTRANSQSNKVTVPNPPPGATTVPPPPPASGNGAPPVVKGTPTGVSRSSGFSSSGSSSATTPTSEAVTPDPGFVRGLPYAAGSPAPDNSGNEGDNSAVAVTPGRHKSDTRGIFVPVAAGAILFVGAFHMRILKKRLDEPPSTSLTPVA
jgi:hypothetical protein